MRLRCGCKVEAALIHECNVIECPCCNSTWPLLDGRLEFGILTIGDTYYHAYRCHGHKK